MKKSTVDRRQLTARRTALRALSLLTVSCGLSTLSCGDPYRDPLIKALGDEDPNFPPGELHRPGQPCLACHSKYGGAPELAVAGTLFNDPKAGATPFVVGGYTARITDSEGQARDLASNRCGNFFIRKSDWDPAYPLRAELYGPSPKNPQKVAQLNVMSSRIGRDGSCASCHIGARSPFSPGVVYVPELAAGVTAPGAADCPGPWLGPDPRVPQLSP